MPVVYDVKARTNNPVERARKLLAKKTINLATCTEARATLEATSPKSPEIHHLLRRLAPDALQMRLK